MLAKDVSIHREIYCVSDTPLQSVFQMLTENNCDCVAIVESLAHKNPIGSVSEHDICLKTIRDGLNPQRLTAARVMNGNITTVRDDTTVEDCALLMKQTNCDKLFVVDENGAYSGILTDRNLVFEERQNSLSDLLNVLQVNQAAAQELHLAY